ncbi:MAG: rhomboid family intramembrane serine protease [Lachnospiraceae bacterium]|nr:rhomboid family intramembrane serine protease [Lachnospiraceae bacterium]
MDTDKTTIMKFDENTKMKTHLDMFLQENGYQMIPSNVMEYTIYFQWGNNLTNVLLLITDHEGLYLEREQYDHVKASVIRLFEEKGIQNIHVLSLIISSDLEKVKKITEHDTFCWILEPVERRLMIYENQVEDFYGMKHILEECLSIDYVNQNEETGASPITYKKDIRQYPYITIGITAINILIFLICTFSGDLLYNVGALNVAGVLRDRQFYRVISCMFLHADVHHLFSNMVMYYFLGEIVEKNMGHIKYFTLYFLSGIGGSILSMVFSIMVGSNVDSVGASGAIFGVIGALLWLALTHRGDLEHITLGKVLFLIIYSLYSGFTGTHIDNAAHIGGLITGFLCTFGMGSVKNES